MLEAVQVIARSYADESSIDLNADWQRAAAGLLVSIGSHLSDLMMEEIFLHFLILAYFASADVNQALQFTPHLEGCAFTWKYKRYSQDNI